MGAQALHYLHRSAQHVDLVGWELRRSTGRVQQGFAQRTVALVDFALMPSAISRGKSCRSRQPMKDGTTRKSIGL